MSISTVLLELFSASFLGRRISAVIVLALAALVVYPDACLTWLSSITGKTYRLRHLLILEAGTWSLIFVAASSLRNGSLENNLWFQAFVIGVVGMIRFIKRVVEDIFR